ncbi:MAG TPA: serine/threonine-protein kinase [Verrucomicrobiae bacterium]
MSCSQQPHIPDYEMLRPIGRGAFGEVWLARAITGQFRAVKILERAALPNQRAFDREFEGLLRYEPISRSQPNLVQVLHVGRAADRQAFWYVMELADDSSQKASDAFQHAGAAEVRRFTEALVNTYEPRTLRSMLREKGRLAARECLPIAIGLAEAVAHLHAQGLVHRDIKPSNVIFVGGTPKLADIGLVTAAVEQPSFVGTAGYIPPDGPGTPAADIYALGKVYYEMGTGREVRDFPRLPDDFNEAPDRAALIEFNEIIVHAADLDPRRRYPSAVGLRSDLLLLSAGRSLRGLRRLERRLRVTARAGAMVLGVAVVSIALGLWANGQRLRAVNAERELSNRLLEQQLALARATRLTGLPGQREKTLEIVRDAAHHTNSLALRNEAIAALASPDVSHLRTIEGTDIAFDLALRRYVKLDANGDLMVRSVADDHPLALLGCGAVVGTASAPVGLAGFNFSATGDYIFATCTNHQLLIWCLELPTPADDDPKAAPPGTKTLEPVRPHVVPLAFEPTGQLVVPNCRQAAIGSGDGKVHLFDLEEGREVRTLEGPCDIHEIAFSPDATRYAGRKGNVLSIYDLRTGRIRQSYTNLTGFEGGAWHPDGRQIASWSGERALRLWNLETGNPSSVLRANEAEVIGAAFDGTGQWLISTSWDNHTLLWGLAHHKEALRVPGSGNIVQFGADARRFAWRAWNGRQWEVFDLAPTTEMVRLEQHPGLETPEGLRSLWCLAFLSDDVLAGAGDGGLCLWQPPTSYASVLARIGLERPLFAIPGREMFSSGRWGMRRWPIRVDAAHRTLQIGPPEPLLPATPVNTTEYAVSTNGLRIASVTSSRQLLLLTEREPLRWRELADRDVYVVAIDPAGRFVAATLRNGGARIWEADSGSIIADLACPLGRICQVSPDGQWLTVAAYSEFLIWRVADWRLARRIPRDAISGPVQGWSPDGELFAVHHHDATVTLLRGGTWEELVSLPCPNLLHQCCFSPDGRRLALLGEKTGVELWDLRRLRQRLATMGLDWPGASFPAETRAATPQQQWKVRVAADF